MCDSVIETYHDLDKDNKIKIREYVTNILTYNKNCINYQNTRGETLLILAIKLGDYITALRLLLTKNIVVKTKDSKGLTAFDYAVMKYSDNIGSKDESMLEQIINTINKLSK